jgi:exosortase F-associated protein
MKKGLKFLGLLVLIFLLIVIREFVAPLLYDPLASYFKEDYLYKSIPSLNLGLFFVNIFIRYALNSIVSIGIIYLFFEDFKIVWFSFKLYIIAFIILIISLWLILNFHQENDYLLLFYVRRFLIHPIFVLLLIPAFYFQRLKKE